MCPTADTKCPATLTRCVQIPTECVLNPEPTICPFVLTSCPPDACMSLGSKTGKLVPSDRTRQVAGTFNVPTYTTRAPKAGY